MHIIYMLQHMDVLFNFYSFEAARIKWCSYIGHTRKNLKKVTGAKCLWLSGNGLKNKSHVKFKGLRHGVSERVYRQLRLREKFREWVLIDIDEHRTSKTCNSCFQNNLKNLKCGNGDEEHKIHQILICERCNIYWNHVMATKNMFIIAQSIWNGNGRPHVF
ncbi:hypothetical protein AB4K20DRAFT_1970644 [Rhizopus microsporus]